MRNIRLASVVLQAITTSALLAAVCATAFADGPSLTPATMLRIGTVDERFQSYNIEMVEVTGGKFWKPYGADRDPGLYAYRPPIDLTNSRLRKLATALAPAYLRASGTWANTTYFPDSDDALAAPPPGFKSILTRQQWQGVVDFSQAVDAPIVTSFAISAGVRDNDGLWTPDMARRFLAYTRAAGGSIAAAEFMNEPDLVAISGAPPGYDATAYKRDFKVFLALMKQAAPSTMILGPGAAGETQAGPDLVGASAGVDALSYHHYATLSERCLGTSAPEAALSEEWLSRTDRTFAFYRLLRDRFEPDRPIWLTETAGAACGGNRWDATFLDTFRYLDQLGRLAKAGVRVVMHNTLAASDYGLLDEKTLTPRPNYWGALLWRQLMGATVLDSAVPAQAGLHVYAHCQRGMPGGVTLLVVNNGNAPRSLSLPDTSERYTLDAENLQDPAVRLNGSVLALDAGGELPNIAAAPTAAGIVTFAPVTITFLALPTAANSACDA